MLQSKRLFLAIALPQELRAALLAPVKARRVEGVRPSPPEQLHITLRFLGDVEAGRQAELCAALASLSPWKPFRLTVEGAGLLPARRAPKVVYAGLAESPELRALKDSVDAALGACRFPAEGGAFRPHITLARVRDGADRKLCDALAASLGKAKAFSFEASSFALHSSELLPSGAIHKLEAEFFSSSSGGGTPRESSRRLS